MVRREACLFFVLVTDAGAQDSATGSSAVTTPAAPTELTSIAPTLDAQAVATTTQVPNRSAPPLSAASCLLWYGDGCAKITDKDLCLSSRDGRPFRDWKQHKTVGQPCTWCGGTPCEVNSTSLCMPFDWVKDSYAKPTSNFQVATCEFAKPLPKMSLDSPQRTRNVTFNRIGNVCRGTTITDSYNFKYNYYWIWTATSLDQCQAFCDHKEMCTGIEYDADDNYCEVWWKPMNWSDSSTRQGSECYRAHAPITWDRQEFSCLNFTKASLRGGCGDLYTQDECLNHRDGREIFHWKGYRIRGEPCAWCNGKPCTDKSDKLCEPQDWLENGMGHVYDTFLAKDSYVVANCSGVAGQVGLRDSFVVGDGEEDKFWISASGDQKHLVSPDLDCDYCGCKTDVKTIESVALEEIPQGAPFDCSMIPTAAGMRAITSSEPTSQGAAETTAAPESEGGGGGTPWWVWFIGAVVVVAIVAGVLAVSGVLKGKAAKKNSVNKRKRAANLANGNEEEKAALLDPKSSKIADNSVYDTSQVEKPASKDEKEEEQFPGYAMTPTLSLQQSMQQSMQPYLPNFFGPPPVMQPQHFAQYAPLVPQPLLQPQPQAWMQPQQTAPAYGPYVPSGLPNFDAIDPNHHGAFPRQEFAQATNPPAGSQLMEPIAGSLRPIQVVEGVDQRLAGASRGMLVTQEWPQQGQADQASEICAKCGNVLLADSRFCRKCGTPRGAV